MREGFEIRTIPERRERVCNGCKYLDVTAMLRGHKENTDNYTCQHPDFLGEVLFGSKRGRSIHFNHSGSCDTPYWCPFLKPKHNEQQQR